MESASLQIPQAPAWARQVNCWEGLRNSFLVPGFVLLMVNGFGHCPGGYPSLTGHLRAGATGLLLGVFLMTWIAAQVWWIGLIHWLQPLYIGLGVSEAILSTRLTTAD